MSKKIKILIADDHQLVIEGLLSCLKGLKNLEVVTSNSCEEAYELIKEALEEAPFQILFTDLSFDNASENKIVKSGEELIKKLQQEDIAIKIGVITGHFETNRVFNVVKNLKPQAYILKGKCSTSELSFAIKKMMSNDVFYTHEVHQKLLKRAMVEIQMDEVAIQILRELPKQPKISNLEGVICKPDGSMLKIRSIESKLAKLRADLNANNNTDLVLKAKELGILD